MMRIPSLTPQEDPQGMSAMSDVVFLLLIFFIVTMSGYVEMTLLETNLPTASAAASNDAELQNTVKIELSEDGQCIVNGTPQSPEHLKRLLSRYTRLMPDAEFLIQCEPETKHHQLVALLSEFARHKLKNIKLLKS